MLVVATVYMVTGLPLSAQSTWAPPRLIPYYDHIYAPQFLADKNRTVHAFNAEKISDGSERVIMYRQWTLEQGWTPPIDILYRAGSGTLEVVGVLLDEESTVQLVFYDGNPPGRGDLYYMAAPLVDAGRTTAWSTPILIGNNAGPIVSGSLTGDEFGKLVVVYSGVEEGLGLYETHTTDSGKTWSQPTPIAFAYGDDVLLGRIQTLLDDQGRVHAVWSELSNAGLGQVVYYAQMDLDKDPWSPPIVLARREGNDYAADWPSITDHKGELMVIYYDGSIPNGVPPTRWMRQSRDGGQTWTEPVQPFPHVGENGFPVLLTDSNQVLHIVLANRVGTPAIGGMWHGVWLGDRWSELEPIAVQPEGSPATTPSVENDTAAGAASRPSAVVSQGNVLLVTWWHDMSDPPPAGYSFRILDAPEVPLVALPTPVPPTPVPTPTPGIISPTPRPLAGAPLESISVSGDQDPPKQANPSQILLTGLIPSLALLTVAATVIIRHRRAR
jgi:hypothetical protein